MNIIEATKKAMKENMAITNAESKENGIVFIPTNSKFIGFMVLIDNSNDTKKKLAPSRYWQPTAADLLRKDWELY